MRFVLAAVLAVMIPVAAMAAPNDGGPIGNAGTFNASCPLSHSAPDDPIVFPGQPGASHLHDFFGNTSTNAFSTPESLVANPGTTCVRQGEDGFEGKPGVPRKARSGYWVPALYEDGIKVDPTSVTANYENKPTREFAQIRPFPAGFKMVFGTSSGGVQNTRTDGLGQRIFDWACLRGGITVKRSTSGAVPPVCNQPDLYLDLRAPDCWDGVHLDSPNHKSHAAYGVRNKLGVDGYFVCPPSHPIPLPQLRLRVHYPTRAVGTMTLASGSVGSTEHGDFMNGWDQAEHERLVRECLNKNIYCGFGDTLVQ